MLNFARVISVSENSQKVLLASVFSSACINCPSIRTCRHSTKTFTALNIKNFNLEEGNIVRIALKKPVRILQGLCALFLPIALCILALDFAPILFKIAIFPANIQFNETIRFLTGFSAFILGELAIFIFSRATFIPLSPIIKQKI